MKSILVVAILALISTGSFVDADNKQDTVDVVTTEDLQWMYNFISIGMRIRGLLKRSLGSGHYFASFTGIPYAEKPLRFSKALPKTLSKTLSSSNILDATKDAVDCLHLDFAVDHENEREQERHIIGSEDCLLLNIFRPEQCNEEKLCPVLVFLHPTETTLLPLRRSSANFEPDLIMESEARPVVLVTINFRLDLMSYWSLENQRAPGNLALHDQRLALDWIRTEISIFGGDPERITLFGYNTLFHILKSKSNTSAPVKRVISHFKSIGFDQFMHFDESRRDFSLEAARKLGCNHNDDDQILECMRAVDSGAIQSLIEDFATDKYTMLPNPFGVPHLDGDLLPDWPENMFEANLTHEKVDLMLGDVSDSGLARMAEFILHPAHFVNFSRALPRLALNLDVDIGDEEEDEDDVHEDKVAHAVAVMRKSYMFGGHNHRLNMRQGSQLISDFVSRSPIGASIRLLSKRHTCYQFVYKYTATHTLADFNAMSQWKMGFKMFLHHYGIGYGMRSGYGATLGDELLLLFPIKHLSAPMGLGPLSNGDKEASNQLIGAFTNFAYSGKPNNDDELWPESKAPNFTSVLIKTRLELNASPVASDKVDFFLAVRDYLFGDNKDVDQEHLADKETNVNKEEL